MGFAIRLPLLVEFGGLPQHRFGRDQDNWHSRFSARFGELTLDML
jgi:hypothetical protein